MSYSAHMNTPDVSAPITPDFPPARGSDYDTRYPAGNHPADVPPTQVISGKHGQPNINIIERLVYGAVGATLICLVVTKKDKSPSGISLAALGAGLIAKGVTGYAPLMEMIRTGTSQRTDSNDAVIPHGQGIKVERSVTINRPADELYTYWRNFENLPRFMNHLESVTEEGDVKSHWVAKAPLGQTVSWDAEIINEKPGELIAWKSLEGAMIPNAGAVTFKTLPAGRGTAVKVELMYNPPAGNVGAFFARLLGEEPDTQVKEDLRRFKAIMETGEIPTAGTGTSHSEQQNTSQDEKQPGHDVGDAIPLERLATHTPDPNPFATGSTMGTSTASPAAAEANLL